MSIPQSKIDEQDRGSCNWKWEITVVNSDSTQNPVNEIDGRYRR